MASYDHRNISAVHIVVVGERLSGPSIIEACAGSSKKPLPICVVNLLACLRAHLAVQH